jgi:hypothetical protein
MNCRKRSFILMILGIILAFALAGCGNPAGNDNGDTYDDGNPYGDWGTGWPSDSKLGEYGLSGISAPAGANNIEWYSYDGGSYQAYNYPVISISFNATGETADSLAGLFSSNGWTGSAGYGAGSYTKGNAAAWFGISDGSGALVAGIPAY